MDGVLVLDKPAGMTSHDAVNRLRRITGERSIGHLGTLDPMATGVLPMLLGRKTRLAQFYLHCEKEYEGEIRLGFATDTYDATGQAEQHCLAQELSQDFACAQIVSRAARLPCWRSKAVLSRLRQLILDRSYKGVEEVGQAPRL